MKIPEKLTRNQTILLTLGLLIILGVGGVVVVPMVFPSIVETTEDAASSVVDIERQRPIQTKFDIGLFTDPRWSKLKKVSGTVDVGILGRVNPFAPVEEVLEGADQSGSSTRPRF